jgi:acetyltransferase
MLASASPETYASCLRLLLSDPNVDAALVILPPPPMFKAEEVAEKLIEVIESNGRSPGANNHKPVVIALLGSTLIEKAHSAFEQLDVPTYPFPERAASALSALFRRAEYVATESQSHREKNKFPSLGVSAANPDELLNTYEIPVASIKLAHDESEAVQFAEELGFPVVMKVASPDILHKSDVGGVVLNIQDAPSLQFAYTQTMERVKQSKPEARIDGVHIQRQIPDGQEVIVGMVRDPQFGPLMMFGAGGVEVEGLKDVAFALAPLDQAEAGKMIRKTWAGRKLKGFRNIPPADEESVVDVLVSLSRLALENESIEEIEINPLRVLGKGAVAVDVRMKRK